MMQWASKTQDLLGGLCRLRRYSGNELNQRRMLGIQAKVAVPRHISGIDMVGFIPCDGVGA
jgi:hypothetical protein